MGWPFPEVICSTRNPNGEGGFCLSLLSVDHHFLAPSSSCCALFLSLPPFVFSCLFLLPSCNSGGAQCWTSFLAKAAGLWVPHLFLIQLNDCHSNTHVAHSSLCSSISQRNRNLTPGLLSGLLSRPAMLFMLSNFSFLGKREVEKKWPLWNPVPWVLFSTDSAVTEREWPHRHFAVGQSLLPRLGAS